MGGLHQTAGMLQLEGRSLLARLDQLRPLGLHETMIPAAALPPRASLRMERFLHAGRTLLRAQVKDYLEWIGGPGLAASPAEQQSEFVRIRMRFNAILAQFDMFAEVVTQRSEHGTGVWLAGLDALAADALAVVPHLQDPPPTVCYLARGAGAAIRRAHTRLPGGDASPVAIIRIPRERMVGQGIASSLVHEVGHQGAALLDLVPSLRAEIARARPGAGAGAPVWLAWDRWVSEIVGDLWSVATLGISATVGLLAVVSLPTYFVFRPSGDDPHPIPYVRVLLSCAMGRALYPHPQWDQMVATWKAMYPVEQLPVARRREFAVMEEQIPAFVNLLVKHRADSLGREPLGRVFPIRERTPDRLAQLFRAWNGDLGAMARQPPSLVFAAVGQARATGHLAPEAESELLSTLLSVWALRSSLNAAENLIATNPVRRAS